MFGEALSATWWLWWSLTIAVVSLDVTVGRPFRGFRSWVTARSVLLGQLFRCGFCLSHYLALLVVLAYGVNPLWTFPLVATSGIPMLVLAALLAALDTLGST